MSERPERKRCAEASRDRLNKPAWKPTTNTGGGSKDISSTPSLNGEEMTFSSNEPYFTKGNLTTEKYYLDKSAAGWNLDPPLFGPLQFPKMICVIPEGVKIIPKPEAQDKIVKDTFGDFNGMMATIRGWEEENYKRPFRKRKCKAVTNWWECIYCWKHYDKLYGHGILCAHCGGWRKYDETLAWAKVINRGLKSGENWSWFITWTFRDPEPWAIRRGWNRMGRQYAWKAWRAFVFWMQHHLYEEYGSDYDHKYFVVMEGQKRGTPHFHAVFYSPGLAGETSVDSARRNDRLLAKARHYLWVRGGYNKIYTYKPTLGAELYMAKYLSKEMEDWSDEGDFQPEWIIRDPEETQLWKNRSYRIPSTAGKSLWRHTLGVNEPDDLPF